MEEGLAIMEELMQPIACGQVNQLKLIELTQNQARALYGSLTYLQLLDEKLVYDIHAAYKASLNEAASKPQMTKAP